MKDMSMMSPQDIALEYNGNKQKIAAAAQSGLIDPTAAVMAGMFIDRMRAAAAQEQAAPTTVKQDVLAPAALGATPEAQQLAQGQARAMQAMPPAQSGLAALPVDESMVPEESYAGGGIVAFAGPEGSLVEGDEDLDLSTIEGLMELQRRRNRGEMSPDVEVPVATPATPATRATSQAGKTPSLADLVQAQMALREQYAPMGEDERAAADYFKSAATRAAAAKSRGFNEFLTEMGFRAAASKSPRALQAFGEAGAGAVPRLTAAGKEAREIEEAGIKGRADLAKAERAQKLAGIAAGERMYGEERTLMSREQQAELDRQNRMAIAMIPDKALQVAEQLRKDNPNLSYLESITQASQALLPKDTYNATRNAVTQAGKAAADKIENLKYDVRYAPLFEKAKKGDKDAIKALKDLEDRIQRDTFRLFQVEGVNLSGGRMGAANLEDPLGIR